MRVANVNVENVNAPHYLTKQLRRGSFVCTLGKHPPHIPLNIFAGEPMDKHLHLVGILNIVYRALSLMGAFVLFFLAGIMGRIFDWLIRTGALMPHEVPFELLDILPLILVIIGLIISVVSVIAIVGGVGLLKRKEWGRVVLLVVSFINLLHVPLGTALGAYSIWVLMNDEAIRQCSGAAAVHAAP
jgi:hypothetical protein